MKKNISTLVLILCSIYCFSQNEGTASKVVREMKEYTDLIQARPDLRMVNLKENVPNIKIKLIYATTQNFTHVRMYPSKTNYTFMRKPAADKLSHVAIELKHLGLGILVWDAYRPYRVTEKFWELIHDERYVANPAKGSGHNRGIAIDMTVYELKTGKELSMPTGFDDFTEAAHHGFMELTEDKIKNRELLKNIMEKNGFKSFSTEWWHYYISDPDEYPVMDLLLSELKNYIE